jgi:hypothetical protein
MTPEQVRECMSEYDVDNGTFSPSLSVCVVLVLSC